MQGGAKMQLVCRSVQFWPRRRPAVVAFLIVGALLLSAAAAHMVSSSVPLGAAFADPAGILDVDALGRLSSPGDGPALAVMVAGPTERAGQGARLAIANLPPQAAIALPDGAVAHIGEALRLEDVSVDPDGRVGGVRWLFGDGSRGAGPQQSHRWDTIGIFTVEMAVRDNLREVGRTSVSVTTFARFAASGVATPDGFDVVAIPGLAELSFAARGPASVDVAGRVAGGPAALLESGIPAPSGAATALRYLAIEPGPGHDGAGQRITIRLGYSDEEFMRLGLSELEATLLYWNGAAWKDLFVDPDQNGVIEGSTPQRHLRVFDVGRDQWANEVWATVNHTSSYAIAAPPGAGPVAGAGGGGGGAGGAGTGLAPAPATPAPPTDPPEAEPQPEEDSDADGLGHAGSAGAGGPGGAGGGAGAAGGGELQAKPELRVGVGGRWLAGPSFTVRGQVDVAFDGQAEGLSVYAVGGDGRESLLGEGLAMQWNTTDWPNGRYRLEARSVAADGAASSYHVHAARMVIVHNPRAELGEAVTAIVVGAGIVAGGAALSSLLVDTAREGAFAIGEDVMRDRTKNVGPKVAQRRRLAAIGAAAATLLLLVAFFTMEALERITWSAYVANLPIVGLAVAVFFAGAYGSEFLLARASGAQARFRFLLSGAVALAFSAGVLRTAFGYPGYIDEDDPDGDGGGDDEAADQQSGREAIRALGALGMVLALSLPFVLFGWVWRWDFGEEGLGIVLATLASSVMPFKPLPGHDIWVWRKSASLVVLGIACFLFVQYQLAVLSQTLLVTLAIVGMTGYALTFRWLRLSAEPDVPAPGTEPV